MVPRNQRGKGVVIGIVDWGFDFDHRALRTPTGRTRLLALWDQRPDDRTAPQPYGYGKVHIASDLDWALCTSAPYETLGYHPGDADRAGSGAHGTHVVDIAAGSGTFGLPVGVAPGTDIVAVHLADAGTSGLATMGDSVRILEAIDFIAKAAGSRPWVINLSMGRHGGPHDGCTLVERALDAILTEAPGRFIVQSAGNYFDKQTHATGQLRSGQQRRLNMVVDLADVTPNELEIWYSGTDRFVVRIDAPNGSTSGWVRLGDHTEIVADDHIVGRVYHRASDPCNGDHHINAFLYPGAPAGTWTVTIVGDKSSQGHFHAWVERDATCPGCQTRFVDADADPQYSIGTLANGHLPLVVGAYDSRSPSRPIGKFSSSGPTRDGRTKPDLLAPGVSIVAARSAPRKSQRSPHLVARKSGTSMAAPHVTGTVALCLAASRRPLKATEVRRLLLDTLDLPRSDLPAERRGRGYLNTGRAVAAAIALDQPDIRSKEKNAVFDSPGAAEAPLRNQSGQASPTPPTSFPKAEQSRDRTKFREAVLAEHLRRSRRRKGRPIADLDPATLAKIVGTRRRLRADAAAEVNRLLVDANAALKQARQAGHADALRTKRITVQSGYRSATRQAEIWRTNFDQKYYPRTIKARAKLPGGPHGDRAIRYMLNDFKVSKRVAAPGYSNHQAGLAADFGQIRLGKRNTIRNSTTPVARRRWRETWFFDWLQKNAQSYQLKPYEFEPWHWEFTAFTPEPTPPAARLPKASTITTTFDQRAFSTIPDFLRARSLARLSTDVSTAHILQLLRLDKGHGSGWTLRLINGLDDLAPVAPMAQLHVDIFETIPLKAQKVEVWNAFNGYARSAYSSPEWPYMATFVFPPQVREDLERLFGLPLGRLYEAAGLPDQFTTDTADAHKVLVYLQFPHTIRQAMLHPSIRRLAGFALNSASLTDTHQRELRRIAREVVRSRNRTASRQIVHAHLIGHTDERGSKAYNLELGMRRARAAKDRLQALVEAEAGHRPVFPKIKFTTASKGEAAPASKNDHQLNRRVEIILDAHWMPPPRPVPIAKVLPRLRRLVEKKADLHPEAREELLCLLSKIPTSDVRYAPPGVVFGAYLGSESVWPSLSLRLSDPKAFGNQLSDSQVLQNFQDLERSIRAGISEAVRLRNKFGAGGGGSADPKLQRLMRHIGKRAKDKSDIYSCY